MIFSSITLKSICLKSVHSGPKSKAVILHDWYDVLGLYFASSHMWRLSAYFEYGRMLESVGIKSSQDSLDEVESRMDSNAIYYFGLKTWNLDLQPAYNRSKLTIQIYISLLLVCGDCPLTSKRGVCWNLLESTPARIPLIKSSHKWTRMLFIILNSKLGIWIFSHPRIDLNSQSNFNDVLTRPYKYFSNTLYKTTCMEHNLHLVYQ